MPVRSAAMAIIAAMLSVGIVAAAARGKQVDRQVQVLKQRIARNAKATSSDGIVKWFADRITLAAHPVTREGATEVQRVRYLMANRSDYQRLAKLAEASLKALDQVCRELDDRIARAGRQEDMVIIGLPAKLARVREAAEYKRAWIRLYLAMSLDDGVTPATAPTAARRRRLLGDAVEGAAAYADAPDTRSEVNCAALLLRGMAAGRLGSADQARRDLQAASAAQAPSQVRMAAMFELARQAIDAGRWPEAIQQTGEFARRCKAVVSADRQIQIDLYAALLAERLYRRQADRATEPVQGARFRDLADEAIADLLSGHADRLGPLCATLSHRWADQSDPGALSGPVAYARGVASTRTAAGEAMAVKCFRSILGRSDRVSRELAPDSLWYLASTLYKQGKRQGASGWPLRREAAEQFSRLAREHSDNQRAAQAAVNAARILGARVAALDAAGTSVATDLRRQYAAALERVVTGWSDSEEVLGYTYQLAQQCGRLGQVDAAIRWYARVAASSPDYALARSNELIFRGRQLMEADSPDRTDTAKALIAGWGDLADLARREGNVAPDPQKKAALLRVAAAADLHIAELLADPLAQEARAIERCRAAVARWRNFPEIGARIEALRIELLLRQGKLREAVEALDQLGAGGQADRLVVLTAVKIGERIDTTALPSEAKSDAAAWRALYLRFARQAARTAAAQPPEAQYPLEQMVAEALAESGRPDEALKIFERLSRSRPADANNIQGMARCHWLARRHGEALVLYRRFVSGVDIDAHPEQWWGGQLALARCAFEQAAGRPDQLKRLAVRLEQLRLRDVSFGGKAATFEQLRRRIRLDSSEE